MRLRLHAYWRSSASYRVRIALGLKGLAYEVCPVDLKAGEQASGPHRGRNPMAQVPTLEVEDATGGHRINQSLAICQWLDAVVPVPLLVPEEPRRRARVWELAEIVNAGTQPLQNLGVLQAIKGLGGDADEWARGAIRRGLEAFQSRLLEDRLPGDFCDGAQPGLADICLVPQIYNARRFAVDLGAFPLLATVVHACEALPAFRQAHPDRQPDAPAAGA